MLEYRRSSYRTTLVAWPGYPSFQLSLSDADWRPPFRTWRGYAAYVREDIDSLAEELELAPEELDGPVDIARLPEFWDQLIHESDTAVGRVYPLLEGYHVGGPFTARGVSEDLGEVELTDGPCPGNDYMGVSASSAVALSCLQYVLDEQESRIRIVVAG